jgi:hypothetical protein
LLSKRASAGSITLIAKHLGEGGLIPFKSPWRRSVR